MPTIQEQRSALEQCNQSLVTTRTTIDELGSQLNTARSQARTTDAANLEAALRAQRQQLLQLTQQAAQLLGVLGAHDVTEANRTLSTAEASLAAAVDARARRVAELNAAQTLELLPLDEKIFALTEAKHVASEQLRIARALVERGAREQRTASLLSGQLA